MVVVSIQLVWLQVTGRCRNRHRMALSPYRTRAAVQKSWWMRHVFAYCRRFIMYVWHVNTPRFMILHRASSHAHALFSVQDCWNECSRPILVSADAERDFCRATHMHTAQHMPRRAVFVRTSVHLFVHRADESCCVEMTEHVNIHCRPMFLALKAAVIYD